MWFVKWLFKLHLKKNKNRYNLCANAWCCGFITYRVYKKRSFKTIHIINAGWNLYTGKFSIKSSILENYHTKKWRGIPRIHTNKLNVGELLLFVRMHRTWWVSGWLKELNNFQKKVWFKHKAKAFMKHKNLFIIKHSI